MWLGKIDITVAHRVRSYRQGDVVGAHPVGDRKATMDSSAFSAFCLIRNYLGIAQ